MDENRRSYIWYVLKLLSKELGFGLAVGGLFAYILGKQLQFLNYELFIQSLVALNSGIIIALFVALFYSSNDNIAIFKNFSYAAKQVYVIFLINSVIVCFLALFMTNIDNDTQNSLIDITMWANLLAGFVSGTVSFVNVRFIYKLLNISFRH